jgi:hypothetical protein
MSFTNPGIIGIDLTETSTTARFIKSHAALTAGLVYSYLEASGLTVAALTQTTDDTSPISLCIPQIAFASGAFGWALVGPGNGVVSVLANCAIDVLLYSTATAGSLDDASASAKVVVGIKLTTANGGSTANVACQLSSKLVIQA